MMDADLFGPEPARSEIRQFRGRSQGAEANHKGRTLEDQVADLLVSYGANPVSYDKFARAGNDLFHERTLIRQYPYPTLIGGKGRVDLVYLHGGDGPRVAIECKVQDMGGSVDDKLYGSCLHTPGWEFADDVWFVLSGSGFRSGWSDWLERGHRKQFTNRKRVRVFTSIDSLRLPARALVQNGDALGAGARRR